MTARRALLVCAAVLGLLAAENALAYRMYRHEVAAVRATLDDRLTALGTTAARWLATGAGAAEEGVLGALVGANHLEDAYVIDAGLTVTSGARTRPGTRLNLMRVDQDRLAAALAGSASVGSAYSVDQAEVEAAYFPARCGAAPCVLTLEAGAEYHAPADGLRATYLGAVALTVVLALAVAAGLVLALRALDRIRIAHGQAERLAAVGQMAAMVAHEVRNPLGILRGQVELARERLGPAAPPREVERFGEMLGEIDRINGLTEEFLNLTRVAPLDLAPLDLAAFARDVVAEAGLDRRAAGAVLSVAAPDAPVMVAADRRRLRQAVHNLLFNAIQIGGDGVAVTLEVALAPGRGARLTVADTGPGVPAALAERLFEPFVTARPGGSGLGLAVARALAERHGGSLVLEPTPEQRGARFSVYLPVEGH